MLYLSMCLIWRDRSRIGGLLRDAATRMRAQTWRKEQRRQRQWKITTADFQNEARVQNTLPD